MARPRTYPELYDDDWLAERQDWPPRVVAEHLNCGLKTAEAALRGFRRRQRVARSRPFALPPSAPATASDVAVRVERDATRNTSPSADRVITRTIAVLDAEQQDSPFPLRDALIDLAATCQAWAASLPTPSVRA